MCVCVGEFGVVYRGNLTGWRGKGQELVAIKTLKGNMLLHLGMHDMHDTALFRYTTGVLPVITPMYTYIASQMHDWGFS